MKVDKKTEETNDEAMAYDRYLAATVARRKAEQQPSKQDEPPVYTDSKGRPIAYRHPGD